MMHLHNPKQTSATDELFEYRSVEKNRLKLAMGITGAVMIIEIIGGLITNSMALLSDAGHMFTHFFALAISFGAIFFANKPCSKERTFGFYRIEILAALFNSLFLFGVTFWILKESIQRILHPAPVLGLQMFFVACVGLAANLASALLLMGASKEDLNVKSAFLHMLADTLSSVVIILGAGIIYFTQWDIIDPLLSVGIAVLILVWGWGLFKDSINILLEGAPKGMTTDEISRVLKQDVPEIETILDLHVWVITSNMYSLTAHVKLRDVIDLTHQKEIVKKIKKILDERFDVDHTTIQID